MADPSAFDSFFGSLFEVGLAAASVFEGDLLSAYLGASGATTKNKPNANTKLDNNTSFFTLAIYEIVDGLNVFLKLSIHFRNGLSIFQNSGLFHFLAYICYRPFKNR